MSMDIHVFAILGTIPADCTLFHIPFEATCHPPLRKWTNLTKPHQPGFGAILLQPHQADFGQPPNKNGLKRSKKGGGKKNAGACLFSPLPVSSSHPKSGNKNTFEKKRFPWSSSAPTYWIACLILKIPSQPN